MTCNFKKCLLFPCKGPAERTIGSEEREREQKDNENDRETRRMWHGMLRGGEREGEAEGLCEDESGKEHLVLLTFMRLGHHYTV